MNINSIFLIIIKLVIVLQNINYSWETENKTSQAFNTRNKERKIVLRRVYLKLYIFKLLLFVSMIEVSILYYFFYPWIKIWEPAGKRKLKHNWKI